MKNNRQAGLGLMVVILLAVAVVGAWVSLAGNFTAVTAFQRAEEAFDVAVLS